MDRWYMPLVIAAGVVLALLIAGVAALEIAALRTARLTPVTAWHVSLAEMDAAIVRGDIPAAAARWRDAHADARRSGHWSALLEVGDGSRRLGGAAGRARIADADARDAYLGGDRDVVAQCMRLAHALAARTADPLAAAEVKRFSDRWAARTLEAERHREAR